MQADPFWKDAHYERLGRLRNFGEMTDLAFSVLDGMPSPVTEVCGPITTGGRTPEQNVVIFQKTITHLQGQGIAVFNQMILHDTMVRFCEELRAVGYPMAILDEFYLPLFESGKIHTLCFLPGWEASKGASWEYEQARRLNIPITYLPDDWADTLETRPFASPMGRS